MAVGVGVIVGLGVDVDVRVAVGVFVGKDVKVGRTTGVIPGGTTAVALHVPTSVP